MRRRQGVICRLGFFSLHGFLGVKRGAPLLVYREGWEKDRVVGFELGCETSLGGEGRGWDLLFFVFSPMRRGFGVVYGAFRFWMVFWRGRGSWLWFWVKV